MPLNTIGVLDLSVITDRLIKMVENCRDASPLWASLGETEPTFTMDVNGSMPESVRKAGHCQVSIYLFHVSQESFHRNTPVVGSQAQTIPAQPLSLDLYYLVTAFADKDWHEEQRAMSIVLRCFHENPIVRVQVDIPVPPLQQVTEEFVVTMEVENSDELSRLWQSITVPMRLSVVYKATVVFLTPPLPARAPARKPSRVALGVDPAALPFADAGQLIGTLRTITFTDPDSTVAKPKIISYDASPATVAPDQEFYLFGANLDQTPSVFLLIPGNPEQQLPASWIKESNPGRIRIKLPATVGAVPANSPGPGVYQLRAGSAGAYRTNSVPFSIAAKIDVTIAPPDPPILVAVAGLFTIAGAGFVSPGTEVLLDTVPLDENSGAPGAGEFQVVSDSSLVFRAPANLAAGRYTVRIRVNGVESDPSWWVNV